MTLSAGYDTVTDIGYCTGYGTITDFEHRIDTSDIPSQVYYIALDAFFFYIFLLVTLILNIKHMRRI